MWQVTRLNIINMEPAPWDGGVLCKTWAGGRPKTGGTVEHLRCSLIVNYLLFSIAIYEVTKVLCSVSSRAATHPNFITPALASRSHCFLLGLVALVILCCRYVGISTRSCISPQKHSRSAGLCSETQPQQCKPAPDEVKPLNTALICSAMPRLNNIMGSSSCSFVQPQAEIQEVNKTRAKHPSTKAWEAWWELYSASEPTPTPPAKPLVLHCPSRQEPHALGGGSACLLLNQRMRHLLREYFEKLVLFLIIGYTEFEGRKDQTNLMHSRGLHCLAQCPVEQIHFYCFWHICVPVSLLILAFVLQRCWLSALFLLCDSWH